jgi:hypothetical protein
VLRPVRQLSGFLAASLRWLRAAAPDCSIVLAYSDVDTRATSTGRRHAGGIYQAIAGFEFVGEGRDAEPHWITADGRRVSRQKAYSRLGSGGRARVAALQPDWTYVRGSRKMLFLYPMAMSVREALQRLEDAPRSAKSRPFGLAIQAPPRPWD